MKTQSNPALPQVPSKENFQDPEWMQIWCKNIIQLLQGLFMNVSSDLNSIDEAKMTLPGLVPWTPVMLIGGVSDVIYIPNGHTGFYQIVDKFITCYMRVALANKGTHSPTDPVVINGLPFASRNIPGSGTGIINYAVNMAASVTGTIGFLVPYNTKLIYLYKEQFSASSFLPPLTYADLTNTSILDTIFTYLLP